MKTYKGSLKNILVATVFAILILTLTGNIHFEQKTFWLTLFITLFYALTFSVVNIYFFSWLGKRYKWDDNARARMIIGVLGFLLLNILSYEICNFLVRVWFLKTISPAQFFTTIRLRHYIFPLMIAAIITLTYHAFYFYKTIQQQKISQQKAITARAEAHFEALKSQLDPHFLFNNLNILLALIDENPHKAQDFTASLAQIYRYVLAMRHHKTVSIAQEITFAQTYLELMNMRFENQIQFQVEPALHHSQCEIIPLSLQLLLENAIKHNRISSTRPLCIEIKQIEASLLVRNTRAPKPQLQKSPGLGLQNIKARYALFTSKKIKIQSDSHHFAVKIPILGTDSKPTL